MESLNWHGSQQSNTSREGGTKSSSGSPSQPKCIYWSQIKVHIENGGSSVSWINCVKYHHMLQYICSAQAIISTNGNLIKQDIFIKELFFFKKSFPGGKKIVCLFLSSPEWIEELMEWLRDWATIQSWPFLLSQRASLGQAYSPASGTLSCLSLPHCSQYGHNSTS